jgi:L-iditol 2-dehydrogenase
MKSVKKNEKEVIIHDCETPYCGDGDIIIKMGACGICGSDLSNILGNSCKPTTKIGHEVAGTIIRIGKNVRNFKIGDRVFVHHHASCGDCYFCKANNPTLCDKFVDSIEPCGMAEEFLLPEWNINKGCLFKIPDSISFEEAAMVEPLGCCIRAWKKLPQNQQSIMIFGAGTIGMIHALLAKYYGFKTVFCIDVVDFRLEFAQNIGMGVVNFSDSKLEEKILKKTNYNGTDIAVIATSDMSTIDKALNLVRKGGIILLMGEPSFDSKCNIDKSKIYEKEVSLLTSYASTNNDINEALDLVTTGSIDVRQLITHRFSFDESTKAIEMANSRQGCLKVIISGSQM